MRPVLTLALVLACSLPARADCLQASMTAITAAQALNAYTIMRYTASGDPNYDQTAHWCGESLVREPLCNAAVNLSLRAIERNIVTRNPNSTRALCTANWLGALAFSLYIRHAIGVQVLHIRF
jgi:hypothetical protein